MAEMEVLTEETKKKADSIQTQFENYLGSLNSLEEGQLVDGVVVQVTDDQVFVDVGYKSEGKIPIGEFKEKPAVGDTVAVVLILKENKHGEVIVSKQKADGKAFWKKLRQASVDKTSVEGKIDKIVKGGYEVNLGCGIRAFLPISQADVIKIEKPESLLGIESSFLIERLYSNDKVNIVLNRRKYMDESMNEKRDSFFETANIGDVVKGEVKTFTSFGAFVDLGGFDGLLHINDMSWGHVTRPKDFVKKGDIIDVKVIRLDAEGKRINLSLKHFSDDPWLNFEEKFHVNDVVKGRVTKLTDFGAFIELSEGIEGLVHISEFSWVKKINKPQDMVKIGDEVECMILGYDIQAGRVSLGLKQVTENPWNTIAEKYPVGMHLKRPLVKVTNAGGFVQLEEGIDAFLHNDDFSWTKKIKSLNSELKVGDEIEGVIIESDPENHRLRIGIKQLSDDPWMHFVSAHHVGSVLEGEVTSITDFGVFVRVTGGIEGLINKANLSASREESFEDAVKKHPVGSAITVYVTDIQPEKQKIAFSVRELKKHQERAEISHYMSSNKDEDEGVYTLGDMIKNKK
ncbi:MAG: 30S ribosomal protein S1 [Treponemataceae bacterium]